MRYFLFAIFGFILFGNLFKIVDCYKYCGKATNAKLCEKGHTQTLCMLDSMKQFGTFVAHCPMTRKLMRVLLEYHNTLRNDLAGGTVKAKDKCCYPKAARMRELIWDNELEYVTRLFSTKCEFEHDKCRNTARFRYAGQNLGKMARRGRKVKIEELLKNSFEGFWDEKNMIEDMKKAMIQGVKVPKTGHFTQLTQDQVSRVGCSIVYCLNADPPRPTLKKNKGKKPKDDHWYMLACNYDGGNVPNLPVYHPSKEIGSKCSDWDTGMSEKYPNLCNNTGAIYPFSFTKPKFPKDLL